MVRIGLDGVLETDDLPLKKSILLEEKQGGLCPRLKKFYTQGSAQAISIVHVQ